MADGDFVMGPVSEFSDADTYRLAAFLDVDEARAFGLRRALWTWAAQAAPLGVIRHRDPERLAIALKTRIDPEQLVAGFLHAGMLSLCEEGMEIIGWLSSDSGRYFTKRSLRQSYRAHILNHITDEERGRQRSPNPQCRWCNGEAPPIPLHQLGLSPQTIEAGKPKRRGAQK